MSNKSELISQLVREEARLDSRIERLTDYIEQCDNDIDELTNDITELNNCTLEQEFIELLRFEIEGRKEEKQFERFQFKLTLGELQVQKESIYFDLCIIERMDHLPHALMVEIIKQLIFSLDHQDMVCVPIEQFTAEEVAAVRAELKARGLDTQEGHWDVLREDAFSTEYFDGGIKDIKSRHIKIDCESIELGSDEHIIHIFNSNERFSEKKVLSVLEDIAVNCQDVTGLVRKKCASSSKLYELALKEHSFWGKSKSFSALNVPSPVSVTAPSPFEAIGR